MARTASSWWSVLYGICTICICELKEKCVNCRCRIGYLHPFTSNTFIACLFHSDAFPVGDVPEGYLGNRSLERPLATNSVLQSDGASRFICGRGFTLSLMPFVFFPATSLSNTSSPPPSIRSLSISSDEEAFPVFWTHSWLACTHTCRRPAHVLSALIK